MPALNNLIPSTKKRKELLIALQQFYQQPVAKVSFELFLTILAVLFFAIFAIRPTLLTMSDLLKEIKDKERIDQQLAKKVAALSTVQTEYYQLENRLLVLDQAIPNDPQIVYSLKIIEKTASDLQLIITAINLNEIPRTNLGLTSGSTQLNLDLASAQRIDLPMSISVSGDYTSIREFVEVLRHYRRSFVIDSVIFTTEEVRGGKQLQAKITVSAPYFGTSDLEESTRWTLFKILSKNWRVDSSGWCFSSSP